MVGDLVEGRRMGIGISSVLLSTKSIISLDTVCLAEGFMPVKKHGRSNSYKMFNWGWLTVSEVLEKLLRVPLPMGQVFKHMSAWGLFSFKPPHSTL